MVRYCHLFPSACTLGHPFLGKGTGPCTVIARGGELVSTCTAGVSPVPILSVYCSFWNAVGHSWYLSCAYIWFSHGIVNSLQAGNLLYSTFDFSICENISKGTVFLVYLIMVKSDFWILDTLLPLNALQRINKKHFSMQERTL